MDSAVAVAIVILAIALFLDTFCGEYPALLHPVVWMGNLISMLLKIAPQRRPAGPILPVAELARVPAGTLASSATSKAFPAGRQSGWWREFWFGVFLAALVTAVAAVIGQTILRFSAGPVVGVQIVVSAVLLKASFALRELGAAAERVRVPVATGNIAEARKALRGLCSRDASELDEEALLVATIQSLAENISDSFVAPLFYYALFGVPAALAYRAINTLDAMIGYRGRFEALGKASARLDDMVNFIPARLTALLMLLAGLLSGRNAAQAWRIFWRDRAKTPSPNGGRPMAMMAGLLGVRLEKKGVYVLGDANNGVMATTVRETWRLIVITAWLDVALCVLTLVSIHWVLR